MYGHSLRAARKWHMMRIPNAGITLAGVSRSNTQGAEKIDGLAKHHLMPYRSRTLHAIR